jgi:hypothetical protein
MRRRQDAARHRAEQNIAAGCRVTQSHGFLHTRQYTMYTVAGSARAGGMTRTRQALVRHLGEQ